MNAAPRVENARRPMFDPRRVADWILLGLVLATVAVLAVGAWNSRLNLSNIDGISYMSIARQYAHGLASFALNGYWSPLVSWAMVPFITVGVDPILAFMIVNAISGILLVLFALAFTRRFTNSATVPSLIAFLGAVSLSISEFFIITPDLLVTTWTVAFAWYLAEMDRDLRPGTARRRVLWGVGLGALGVIGYFTKLFVLPVFIVTVIIWVIARWIASVRERTEPRPSTSQRLWRNLTAPVAALLAFMILVAPWVTALSIKYGEVTLGSSFSVNISQKFDPDDPSATQADPLELPAPPNKYAVAFGEDRGKNVDAAEAFSSSAGILERLKYYVGQRIAVFPMYLDRIATIAPFAFLTMVLLALAFIYRWLPINRHREAAITALVWVVYFLGYAAIAQPSSGGGNLRYYWPLLPLSFLALALLLPDAWNRIRHHTSGWRRWLAAALIAIVPLAGFTQNILGRPAPFSSTLSNSATVSYLYSPPATSTAYRLIQQIERDDSIPADSNIAGTNYRTTVLIAYYMKSHAYGQSGHNYNIEDPAFRKVLADNDIDYFLTFTPVGTTPPDVSDFATSLHTYKNTILCQDIRDAPTEPCVVQVVGLR